MTLCDAGAQLTGPWCQLGADHFVSCSQYDQLAILLDSSVSKGLNRYRRYRKGPVFKFRSSLIFPVLFFFRKCLDYAHNSVKVFLLLNLLDM